MARTFSWLGGVPGSISEGRYSCCTPLTALLVYAAVSEEFQTAVDEFLTHNKVTAFIKGSKDFPQCGFSNTVVQVRDGA